MALHGPSSKKVELLPREMGSLTTGLPPAQPGTLFVMGEYGGMRVAPDADFDVVFGRCQPDVHVCVGADDPHVSRQHGRITRESSRWVLHNSGRLAIRFPGSPLILRGHRVRLPASYTALFIVAPEQEHLFEVRIAAGQGTPASQERMKVDTKDPEQWELSELERIVLTCLAQRYLRQEAWPQPLTWAQVADELGELGAPGRWNSRRAARIVTDVRLRLSSHVDGLRENELPPPLGNTLNHNLITQLLLSATITTEDLDLLDEAG